MKRWAAIAGLYASVQALLALLWMTDGAPGTEAPWVGLPLDDAWIHLVYARSAADLHPFEYNPGQIELGSTSPLWSFVLAPTFWLRRIATFPVSLGAKALGVILTAACATLAHRAGAQLRSSASGVIAGALVATDPWLVFASVSGMEVPLAAALLLAGLILSLEGRSGAAILALALAPVARPEALVVVLPAVLRILVRERTAARRAALALGALAPTLAWSGLCLAVSGRPLPSTFYAKHAPASVLEALSDGPRLVVDLSLAVPSLALGAGWILAVIGARGALGDAPPERRPEIALLMLAGPAWLAGAVWAHDLQQPLAFYWMRYALPAMPLLAIPIALGASRIVARAREIAQERGGAAHGILLLAGVAAGLPFALVPPAALVSADRYAWNCQNIEEMQVALGRWVAAHVPPGRFVATHDAGAIRYFGHHAVLDTVGLNDHVVARGDLARRIRETRPAAYLIMPALDPSFASAPGLRTVWSVRAERYTICDCPQDEMIVRVPLDEGSE